MSTADGRIVILTPGEDRIPFRRQTDAGGIELLDSEGEAFVRTSESELMGLGWLIELGGKGARS